MVIVGGGATGVEIAGALSEMKNFVLPKDYPDLPTSLMHIYLIEAGDRLLASMSQESSAHVERYLREMGVNVLLNKMDTDYNDHRVILKDGSSIATRTFILGQRRDGPARRQSGRRAPGARPAHQSGRV